MVAAALIDRLIHHAEMITLKGKSNRLRERGTGPEPNAAPCPPAEGTHHAPLGLARPQLDHVSDPETGALFGSR